MKKDIAIVLLAVALATYWWKFEGMVSLARAFRATSRNLMVADHDIWLSACQHAAGGGSHERASKWCVWAASVTAESVDKSITDDDYMALGMEMALRGTPRGTARQKRAEKFPPPAPSKLEAGAVSRTP